MAVEMKKARVKMTKPLYLDMSTLYIGKIFMYEFWYDYINPKYGAKLCYTDTDSFIIYINKIALSSHDDKRLQTSDRITTYPYGTSETMAMINK